MYREYGGFWIRTLAFIVDKVILFFCSLLLFVISIFIVKAGLRSVLADISNHSFLIAYYSMTIVINMLYFTYFHGTIGQTPGKKLCGLLVIRKTGEPMTIRRAFIRWLGYFLSSIIFYAGYLWVAFDSHKQGWHDKIAGTNVIKIGSATPEINSKVTNS